MAMSEFHSTFMALEERDPALVLTITRPQLSEEENIDLLAKELNDLVDQRGCRQMIISLQQVQYITSAALGKLIALHRRLHRKDGRLVVCGAFDSVKDVLHASRLDGYFTVTETIDSAIALLAAE
ncbi:MAG: STAS domain-containing protein [Planctomycetaceae bacterium]